jgi:hypothetical protein
MGSIKDMFYKRRTLRHRIYRKMFDHSFFEHLRGFAAGIHAANGLAHAVSPSDTSIARRSAR